MLLCSCEQPVPPHTVGLLALTRAPVSIASETREPLSVSPERTYIVRTAEALLIVAGTTQDTVRADSVSWLLLPHEITVRDGVFRGTPVSVPALLNGALQRWIQVGLPVISDLPMDVDVLSQCDEEPPPSLLAAVRRLNDLVGLQLFLTGCGRWAPGRRIGVTYAEMDNDAELGIATLKPPCFPYHGSCTFYEGSEGSLRLAYDAGPEVVAHELLHALGLGHTCLYSSLMSTEFTNIELDVCAKGRARLGLVGDLGLGREFTAEDAAALQIVLDVSKHGKGLRGFKPRIIVVQDAADAVR